MTKTSKSEATPTCSASSEADNSSLVTKLRQADAERERLQSRSLESNHHHHNGLRGLRSDEEATLLESSEDTDMVAKKMKRATQVSSYVIGLASQHIVRWQCCVISDWHKNKKPRFISDRH